MVTGHQLFNLATGYRGTELLSDTDNAARFVTKDRWESLDDHVRFHERFGQQYELLDAQLEGITLSETMLGTFATV